MQTKQSKAKQIKVKLVENKPNSLLKKIFIYVVCKNKPNEQKKSSKIIIIINADYNE